MSDIAKYKESKSERGTGNEASLAFYADISTTVRFMRRFAFYPLPFNDSVHRFEGPSRNIVASFRQNVDDPRNLDDLSRHFDNLARYFDDVSECRKHHRSSGILLQNAVKMIPAFGQMVLLTAFIRIFTETCQWLVQICNQHFLTRDLLFK